MSLQRLRVKTTLPAPIKVILDMGSEFSLGYEIYRTGSRFAHFPNKGRGTIVDWRAFFRPMSKIKMPRKYPAITRANKAILRTNAYGIQAITQATTTQLMAIAIRNRTKP